MVGLMATSDPYFHRRHSNTVLAQTSVRSLGPGTHKVCLNPLVSLPGKGFDSKCDFAPPTIFLGFLLCPWTWSIYFW